MIFHYQDDSLLIKFVHVNSHLKEPINRNSVEWQLWYGNEMADKLAKNGAMNK